MRCLGLRYSLIPNGIEKAKQLGLRTLKSRRTRYDLMMMHKILTGKTIVNSSDLSDVTLVELGVLEMPSNVLKRYLGRRLKKM